MFKNKIHVVEFNGVVNHKNVEVFYKDMEELKRIYRKKDKIIIRMNCPGGSPALSEEVMSYLKYFNADKEIIMYVENIAASGGYYIACAIPKIYSNRNAIVGSIGVIMQKYEISGLAEKVGVAEDNLSVGEFKQPLSMFKPVDEEGEKYLKENLMNPLYKNFGDAVYESRHIDLDVYGEGRVFIASNVVGSLVDEVMTFADLINMNKDLDVNYICTKKKTLLQKIGFNSSIKIELPHLESTVSFS